jgi:hypothetical protein
MSAHKASELTDIKNKALQSISEWVIINQLVLNTSKKKSIVFGSKRSLRPKPQLELCIKGVTIEQVEEAELLGVILDGQLSWSSQIDKVVVKMGSVCLLLKYVLRFFTQKSTVLVVLILIAVW